MQCCERLRRVLQGGARDADAPLLANRPAETAQTGTSISVLSTAATTPTASRVQPAEDKRLTPPCETTRFHSALDYIPKVPLFRSLPMHEHPALAKAFHQNEYSSGADVITQGQIGHSFFVIKSGKAEVLVDNQKVNELGAGSYFGEQALLHDMPRNATIRAIENLECLELSREDFDKLELRKKLHFKKRNAVVQMDAVCTTRQRTAKDAELEKTIKEALRINTNIGPYLPNDDADLDDIVAEAYLSVVEAGTEIIKQGDTNASLFYILEEGTAEAIKDGNKVAEYGAKGSFGGLALLYQAPRAATVRITSQSKVWCIPRSAMRSALQSQVKHKVEKYAELLNHVSLLDSVSVDDKKTLADALLEIHFDKDEDIITEGDEDGRSFYILESGELSVLKGDEQVSSYKAEAGKEMPHFGEKALFQDEPRQATVRVASEKAIVWVLDRDMFLHVVKPEAATTREGFVKYSTDKLTKQALLGVGGFGKVTLVKDDQTGMQFALKSLSKGHILQQNAAECTLREMKIMRMTSSPFLVRLAATFNRGDYLEFLLEPAMGGEVFTVYMKHNLHGDEKIAMFNSACVLLGLEHLHDRHIVYRDMKPENLLIDANGYCKIADFGLAKFVIGKTFTVCGTPDYFAPEMLKGTGHTFALDWWTLGILIHEFMTGVTPFRDNDISKTFEKISKGIDAAGLPEKKSWALIVKRLCNMEPSERLGVRPGGAAKVRSHAWFKRKEFDWDSLCARTMEAPWKPNTQALDGFDAVDEDGPPEIPYKDPGDGWDKDFEDVYGPASFE